MALTLSFLRSRRKRRLRKKDKVELSKIGWPHSPEANLLENLHLKDAIPQGFSEALAFLLSRSARLQTHADLIIADPPDILEKPFHVTPTDPFGAILRMLS